MSVWSIHIDATFYAQIYVLKTSIIRLEKKLNFIIYVIITARKYFHLTQSVKYYLYVYR